MGNLLKDFENPKNFFCILFRNLETFGNGFVALCLFSIFVVFSIPVYLYRWVLVNILVPCCFRDKHGIQKPVTPLGNVFATEFLRNYPPRNVIVSNFVIEGSMDRNEILKLVHTKWIQAKEDTAKESCKEDQLKYPELQQYIDYWMGFLFWRQDNEFDLNNHVYFHEIPNEKDTDAHSESWLCSLIESLLNKPFAPKRSPWEIHVVEKYQNSELVQDSNNNTRKDENGMKSVEMTAFVLRFHHGLADGFSLLYAVMEGLFGLNVSEVSLATPQDSDVPLEEGKRKESCLTTYLKFPWRLVYDVGAFSDMILSKKWTPWHVPDRKKKWMQIYGRSKLIPIQKLKDIKNFFGVSFTGTVLSCIAAGVQKSLDDTTGPDFPQEITALSPLPLPGHPKRFRNHVTAAILNLPTNPSFNSLERLIETEERLLKAKNSTLPWFSVIYGKLVGSHFAPIARKLLCNNIIPMGLSNFPGPGKEIWWNGRKGLAADFVAGAVSGVAGELKK